MPRAKKPTKPPEEDYDKCAYEVPALHGIRTCPFCDDRPNVKVHVNAIGSSFCAYITCPGCLMSGPAPRTPDATGPLAATRAVNGWNQALDGKRPQPVKVPV